MIGEVIGAHFDAHWNHNWIKGRPFERIRHAILYDFAIHSFDILACWMSVPRPRTPQKVYASMARAPNQTARPAMLGQVLVEKGWITEANLINTLSLQLGVPKITPSADLIDRQLLKGTNLAFLRKNEILPAFRQGDELTVIMADPLNEDRVRELEKTFRCRIQPAIAELSRP